MTDLNTRAQELLQEKEQLIAGNTQFSRVWRNLTGKRKATQEQVDALQTLIEEARTTSNDVQVSQ